MLEGVIQFEDIRMASDLDGAVRWVKPELVKRPFAKSALYPLGFDLAANLLGAAYNPKGAMVLTPDSANNTFTAWGGNMPGGKMSEAAGVAKSSSGFKVTGAAGLSLKVAKSTGLVRGSFKENAAKAVSPVNAIIFQKGQAPIIIGSFRDRPVSGPNESGAVALTSP